MDAVDILNYLEVGKRIDPYNVKQTRVIYNNGEFIVGGFYKFNNDPPDLTSNQWTIEIEKNYQIVDGDSVASLKDVGVNPK